MKKWLLSLALSAALVAPVAASANEVNELCRTVGEFAGEILDARKAGLSRSESLGVVRESVSDLKGEERQLVSGLLSEVVNGVYDLPASDIATSNATEARVYKQAFVSGFDAECRKELR